MQDRRGEDKISSWGCGGSARPRSSHRVLVTVRWGQGRRWSRASQPARRSARSRDDGAL